MLLVICREAVSLSGVAAQWPSHRATSVGTMCALTLNSSHRPDGIFTQFLHLCLQGGGVIIYSGTVTLSSCTITGNTAHWVRAHAQKFPSPQWETHVLLVVAGRRCLCPEWHSVHRELPDLLQHSWRCECQPRMQTSHRPMGRFLTRALASTFASTTATLRSITQSVRAA